MTGDPPIGTEDVFPKQDPDETPEELWARRMGRDFAPMQATPEAGADAIVRRESGVTDFSNAADEDNAGGYQIEDYPGQDDPTNAAGMQRANFLDESPGDTARRGVNDFIRSAERVVDGNSDTDTDTETRPRR